MLQEGLDYYLNEEGLFVLTERYLLNRGYCCGNGCLHCPYDDIEESEEASDDENTSED